MKVRALIIVAVMLAFAGSAWAVTPVDCSVAGVSLVQLNSFAAWGEFRPADVAVSPGGKVFATDNYNNKVTVFSRDGKILKNITVTNPYGITVDDSGNVFVGWFKGNRGSYTGQVNVYDEALNYKGALGSGFGAFTYPAGIAADDSRVFVADTSSSTVKVYDKQTRQFLTAFGGFGYSDGNLVMPTGVSVTSDGTIYVSDMALQYDKGWGIGAGAHIFTIDADNNVTFVKKFASYGSDQGGLLFSSGDVTVDDSGLVLVTDPAKGEFQVFDAGGNYICTRQLESFTMFPRGIEVSGEGKVMVAAHDQIYRYGIGQYTDVVVSPSILQFNEQVCGSTSIVQNITITNNGNEPVDWSASESASWLGLSSTSGTVAQGGAGTINVSVDPSGINAGSRTGTINISAPGVSEKVMVFLTVTGPPAFTAAPASFSFSVVGSDVPTPGQLDVSGSGWTATSPAWISISPSQSEGTLTVASIGINTSALENMEGGNYSGVVTLDTGCGAIQPVNIAVSLSYIKGGTVAVTTNNADATFTISGPETYEGGGTSFQVDGVTEGTYTVSFGAVAGFKAPASVQVQVVNGQTATVNAEYIDLREKNGIILSKVTVTPHESNDVDVYQADGTLSGTFPVEPASSVPVVQGVFETITTSGDFDGDGVDEIAVAHDSGVITGYEADGTVMSGFEFMAYQDIVSVDLASGDLDGNGTDELVVGTGSGNDKDAAIRVFSYTGGSVVDTGVYFLASAKRNGVEVATGDLNGDGVDEILTAALDKDTASLRAWSVDASAGMGAWSAADAGGFVVAAGSGLDLATGDMNADGADEIVIGYDAKEGAVISIYGSSGNKLGGFVASGMSQVFIASGDTDLDGTAEIVVSCACERTPGVVVYRSDGTVLSEFNAFENTDTKGARVSLGQVVAR